MKLKINILFLFLLFGCASLPSYKGSYYRKTYIREEYISLNEFARKYDFHIDFDPFLKKIFLTKGDNIELIFALESPVMLVNGYLISLDRPLKIEKGDCKISSTTVKKIMNFLALGVGKRKISKYGKPEKVYKIRKIILDPGHGGKDPGAIGPTGLKEKDVVLGIAKILKSKLLQAGYKVVMTREDDRYISLRRRIYIANKEKGDLFISIHANSARSYRGKRASGFEVYYLSPASDAEARSLAAAENYPLGLEEDVSDNLYVQATIWDLLYAEKRKESIRLARKIVAQLQKVIGSKSRGVKSANFYVLRGTQMPAILIEVGFISNRYEEAKLKRRDFRNKIAEGIIEGIQSYEREYLFTRNIEE